MGFSGISPLSLVLILFIVIVLFGTSKLKTLGTDLGEAIKNFRQAMNSDPAHADNKEEKHTQ